MIALPAIAGYVSQIFFDLANVFWVGKLGAQAMAAVGSSGFLGWTVLSLTHVSCAGCGALVARSKGANNRDEGWAVVVDAVRISALWAMVLMAVMWHVSPIVFRWMGLDETTLGMVIPYYHIWIMALPIAYLFTLSGIVFNAHGDTKTSMMILGGALAMNVVLDPLLIFGIGPFPEMGVFGAITATIISWSVGLSVRVWVLRRKGYVPPLRRFWTGGPFLSNRARQVLEIGIPQAATSFTWSIVYPLLTVIITRFGMEALAAVSVGHRLESFGYHTANGFAVAIGAMVAQGVGARDAARVRAVLREGLMIGGTIILTYAVICVTFADQMAGAIASDPVVARHAANYLRVISYFEVFILFEIALQGAFNGMGNSRPYMLICVPLTLARVPMAWLFAIHWDMGATGVWWAISVSTFLKGATQWVVFVTSPTNKRLLASMEDQDGNNAASSAVALNGF